MPGLAWTEGQTTEIELGRIASEFAAVTVSLVPTGNGTRLRLTSARSGDTCLLDATVLEAVCRLSSGGATALVRLCADLPRAADVTAVANGAVANGSVPDGVA